MVFALHSKVTAVSHCRRLPDSFRGSGRQALAIRPGCCSEQSRIQKYRCHLEIVAFRRSRGQSKSSKAAVPPPTSSPQLPPSPEPLQSTTNGSTPPATTSIAEGEGTRVQGNEGPEQVETVQAGKGSLHIVEADVTEGLEAGAGTRARCPADSEPASADISGHSPLDHIDSCHDRSARDDISPGNADDVSGTILPAGERELFLAVSQSRARTPWPASLSSAATSSPESPEPSDGPSWMPAPMPPTYGMSVLPRTSLLDQVTGRRPPEKATWQTTNQERRGPAELDRSLLDFVPLLANQQPAEYLGSLAVQESKRALVRKVLSDELQKGGMGGEDAAELAASAPGVVGALLLEAKQADWAAFSHGLPLADGLPAQIPDLLERSGTVKTAVYLRNLGMEAGSIGRALGRAPGLLFPAVVAQVQLLHSVGVRPRAVAAVLQGCPSLLGTPLETLRLSMTHLQAMGVKGVDLGKVIELYPRVLSPSAQASMPGVVHYLQSLGVPPRGLSKMVRTFPRLLGCSVDGSLRPVVELLHTAGLSREEVVKMVTRCPGLLACSAESKIAPTLTFLEDFLQAPLKLKKMLVKNPEILTLHLAHNVVPTLDFFQSLGMGPEDVARMVARDGNILCASLVNVAAKVRLLEGFGLDRPQILQMIGLFPSLINYSEATLRAKHDYLVQQMGRTVNEIAHFPHFFGYHLETRIRARHEYLEAMDATCALGTMLVCKDEEFYRKSLSWRGNKSRTHSKARGLQ